MRLKLGDIAPAFELPDLHGNLVRLSDFAGRRLLISFHRYAACPLCNLHIHELSQASTELKSHGLEIVAIFMSGPQRVADQYESREVPFPILADPDRKAYGPYGVESSIPGMLASFVHPRAMKAFFSGFMPGKIDADTTTLPADFLLNSEHQIVDTWYSSNITQHMPLDRIRRFALNHHV
ncbi:MAG: AhpC/TSA family protein [Planctomyces sp.]|nr:AhpC/TSA family protein [Planctomyces sp.]